MKCYLCFNFKEKELNTVAVNSQKRLGKISYGTIKIGLYVQIDFLREVETQPKTDRQRYPHPGRHDRDRVVPASMTIMRSCRHRAWFPG